MLTFWWLFCVVYLLWWDAKCYCPQVHLVISANNHHVKFIWLTLSLLQRWWLWAKMPMLLLLMMMTMTCQCRGWWKRCPAPSLLPGAIVQALFTTFTITSITIIIFILIFVITNTISNIFIALIVLTVNWRSCLLFLSSHHHCYHHRYHHHHHHHPDHRVFANHLNMTARSYSCTTWPNTPSSFLWFWTR